MSGDLLLFGDPHGEWLPLLHTCRVVPPAAVVLLGGCDLAAPLREQIAPIFEAGIKVRWIHGNHDCDWPEWYDRLWGDYPEGHLHARAAELAGLTVAGVGGTFQRQVWEPRLGTDAAAYDTRSALLRVLPRNELWRGGLPLGQRAAIFPEDIRALGAFRADLLVSHEAPSAHRYGSIGIDDAAAVCGARMIVHGHHHESYFLRRPLGVTVRGLGRAVFRLHQDMFWQQRRQDSHPTDNS